MADKAISALTSTASVADADELVLNQDAGGGAFVTKRIAVSAFKGGLGYALLASLTFTGAVGIGMTPANVLDITQTNTGVARVNFLNVDAGTGAALQYRLDNGTGTSGFTLFGSGWATSGTNRQNGTKLSGGGAGSLTLATDGVQPIYFSTNGTDRMQLSGSYPMLSIGTPGGPWGHYQYGIHVGPASADQTCYSADINTNTGGHAACYMGLVSSTNGKFFNFKVGYGGGFSADIRWNSSNIVYGTTSDEILKNFNVPQRDFGAMIDAIEISDARYHTTLREFPDTDEGRADAAADILNSAENVISISAQQAAHVGFVDVVVPPDYDDPDDRWQADYSHLAPYALWGVKNLRIRVAKLEAEVELLRGQMAAALHRLDAIDGDSA